MSGAKYLITISILGAMLYITAGTIVLLRGTACAGKTSLIKEIISQGDWVCLDEDALVIEQYPHRWKQLFPAEFKTISNVIKEENILHAILWADPIFIEQATKEQQNAACNAIGTIRRISDYPEIKDQYKLKNILLPKYKTLINDALSHGNNVIVDSVWLLPEEYNEFKEAGHKIVVVVGYCSLSEAFNRLAKRNDEAAEKQNNYSRRYVRQLLCSFYHGFKSASSDQEPFEVITREQLQEIFKRAQDMINLHQGLFNNYGLFSRCELTQESFEALKQMIVEKFNFDKEHQVGITYSTSFDHAIFLDLSSPNENAKKLIVSVI